MTSTTKRVLTAVLVAALGAAGSNQAMAQKKGKKDPAQAEKEAKEKQAYDLYQQGITNYNLGEFDAAIEKFKAAYALTGAPGLLFNVAQAYRLKKDYEQALYFYKTYLRLDPDAPNKGDVEARITEMERFIQEQKNLDKAKPVGTIPPGGKGVPDDKSGDKPGPTMPPATPMNGDTPPTTTTTTTKPVASTSSPGSDGGSAVSDGGDGDTGLSARYVPRGGTLGAIVRFDVDTGGKGAASVIGLSYALASSFEVSAAVLVTGKLGATVGGTFLFSSGRFRPLLALSLPMFFDEGTHVGVHGAVGLRFDLSAHLGIEVDLGGARFFSVPNEDIKKTYFIPSIGIQGRL